jgi:hypothetical protein
LWVRAGVRVGSCDLDAACDCAYDIGMLLLPVSCSCENLLRASVANR